MGSQASSVEQRAHSFFKLRLRSKTADVAHKFVQRAFEANFYQYNIRGTSSAEKLAGARHQLAAFSLVGLASANPR